MRGLLPPYTVTGGEEATKRFVTLEHALSYAIHLAERTHEKNDGEEYHHGVVLDGRVVATAVRETDGSITARRKEPR